MCQQDLPASDQEAKAPCLGPDKLPFVFGVSVQGPGHAKEDLPCQDACAFEVISSRIVVVAVADGLGSAIRSEAGATLAVTAALESLKASLEGGALGHEELQSLPQRAVHVARKRLEEHAAQEGLNLRDLACTLIVLAATGDALHVAHIGDGAVVAETEHGLELISGPGESEYVNEVIPLTSRSWESALRVSSMVKRVNSVVTFTDGCQRAALKKSSDGCLPYEGFFRPLISYAMELQDLSQCICDFKALLTSPKMCENSEDDKTLVLALLYGGIKEAE